MDNKSAGFAPYTGGEPYVFVSYSHQDSDRVLPILEAMHRKGYRIWYDEGILPGGDWKEELGGHIAKCEAFMAFISKAWCGSGDCGNELALASGFKRKVVPIHLEENIEYPSGVGYDLIRSQRLKLDHDSIDKFLDKIGQTEEIKRCQDPSQGDFGLPRREIPWYREKGIQWYLFAEGILVISPEGSAKAEKIPNYLYLHAENGCGGPWARDQGEEIVEAVIRDGITRIGDAAFLGCENLKTVKIPESVAEIGRMAFQGCKNLKQVEIPGKTRIWGDSFPPHTKVTVRR